MGVALQTKRSVFLHNAVSIQGIISAALNENLNCSKAVMFRSLNRNILGLKKREEYRLMQVERELFFHIK